MTITEPPTNTSAPGRRDSLLARRKRETRTIVVDAALDLFDRQGVEATTVEQIAHAAGISVRTFFRYFPRKEAPALIVHEEIQASTRAALATPMPGETPVTTLRRAFSTVLSTYGDGSSVTGQQVLRVARIMVRSPALRAAMREREVAARDGLIRDLAEVLGVDPSMDVRPLAVAEIVGAAVRTTAEHWAVQVSSGVRVDCGTLFDEIFDLMVSGVDNRLR